MTFYNILCAFTCGYHGNPAKILHSYQKCWIIIFIAQCLISDWPSSSLILCCLLTPWNSSLPVSLSWLLRVFFWTARFSVLASTVWLSYSRSPTPNWQTYFVNFAPYFQSHRFTQAHLFMWSLHQKRQRMTFQTIWSCSKMLKIKFLPWPPIHEHIERPPGPTHTHVYTHTHTHTHIIVPHW